MFIYSYCYVCSVLYFLFHCVVLCIVCVLMCTVLLLPGVNPIAVNKYISLFILVINQFDAQTFYITLSLFHASTCFEHHVLITMRSKLYYTSSGIITPIGVMIPEAV